MSDFIASSFMSNITKGKFYVIFAKTNTGFINLAKAKILLCIQLIFKVILMPIKWHANKHFC
ncbi:hypothetical protein [uncultured Gammaproteobacteria bacterium]|nr:hypothetical protein [uncultured Gammaproteobacteria bacterium]